MVKHTDGRHGMPGGRLTALSSGSHADEVPRHFVELLATHSVLIAPIGPGDGRQIMTRISKVGSRLEQEDLMPVRYQPSHRRHVFRSLERIPKSVETSFRRKMRVKTKD
ncbi:hypothetical protein VXQ18_03730 [Brucella abortus]|nr:hypothetical protein [Brucella abortus]